MLYCEIRKETESTVWKRIFNWLIPSWETSALKSVEQIYAMNLMFREPCLIGYREIERSTLANAFGSLVAKLAERKQIRLLFPLHNEGGAIKRALRKAKVEYRKEGSWLLAVMRGDDVAILARFLEAVSFTEFYAQVDGSETIPKKTSGLFESLADCQFICVFILFDESMEIISKLPMEEAVLEAARQVGQEMGFQVELAGKR